MDYLQNFETKTSNFYGLPKVHKSKQINEKYKLAQSNYVEITEDILNLKLRPIVGGPSCQMHRTSNLIFDKIAFKSSVSSLTPIYETSDQLPDGYNRFP